MMSLLLGFGLPVLVLSAIILRCLDSRGPRGVMVLGLASGLGTGAAAAGFCAWRFIVPAWDVSAFPWAEGIALGLLTLVVLPVFASIARAPRSDWSVESRYVACAAAAMGAVSLVYFTLQSDRMPHGEWDAWAIWNLKARFLFRSGEHWQDLFAGNLPHSGYPLLVPSAVARLWTWIGHESPAVGALVAGTFTYATPLVVAGSLAHLRGWTCGAWGGLLTIAAMPLSVYGAWQVADVPFGFFVVASVALVSLAATSQHPWRLALLAGMAVGMAGLVKHEGQPFMLGMTAASIGHCLRHRRWSAIGRAMYVTAFVGAALPFWVLLALIRDASPDVGLASAFTDGAAFAKVTDLTRHVLIARSLLVESWGWAGLAAFGSAPLFASALLLGGWRWNATSRAAVGFGCWALALMIGSYYAAYLVSPYDLAWHISSSLHRILVHIWPTFVWVFCLLARFDSDGPVRTAA
jgi:hypothetical protein